jgi:hypothetical protein
MADNTAANESGVFQPPVQMVVTILLAAVVVFFSAQPGEGVAFLAGRFVGAFLVLYLITGWVSGHFGASATEE